jgi:serine/threonine protein kinase/formylglycine-generating enzyme required for sulfatase activity/WD40 repeat protein
MSDLESTHDLLSNLAHEFAERVRQGEPPSLTEYAKRYPDLADQIRELFPALMMMEAFGSVAGESPLGDAASAGAPRNLGEYRILREIGRGGMGVVYEAVQESLGRHVALKVLPLHHLMGTTHLERFEREAKAAARLHHTNIVPVFGIGVHEGVHYYAMQFLQGQAVDAVLEEVRRLRSGDISPAPRPLTASIARGLMNDTSADTPLDALPAATTSSHLASATGNAAGGSTISRATSELTGPSEAQYFRGVARLGVQVSEALAYAHRQGIVHRDIKPSNLLLDTQGVAWITDFGLVKDECGTNLTSPGDIIGTVRYMAPERFQDQGDGRCDIYSLGATLYEMLTLMPAFPGEQRADLIDRVRHEEPRPPRQLDRHIPRDLETVVLKAMAKEPARRYQDAAELAEDLRRFLADRPVLARRSTMLERSWRWCRRNPTVAALAGSVFVLLAVLLGGALHSNARLQDQLRLVELAEQEKTNKLWDLYLERAEASRLSAKVGRRFLGLDAVRHAAEIRYDLRLRNEAIALFLLADMRVARALPQGTIAFDPPFERYARGDLKGRVHVYRVADDQKIASLDGPGTPAREIHFSPDGRYLAALHEKGGQRVWDVNQARIVLEMPTFHGYLGFSANSDRLAIAGPDGQVQVVALPTGDVLRRIPFNPMASRECNCVFDPYGRLLAAQCGDYRAVRIRDLDTVKGLRSLEPATAVAWDPGGTLLALVNANQITIWNRRTWTKQSVLSMPGANISAACFNPEGDLLASAGLDGILRLWNPWTGVQLLSQHGVHGRPQFSSDGRLLGCTQEGKKLLVWEVTPARECRLLPLSRVTNHGTWDAQFSPDDTLLVASGGDGVQLWDLAHGCAIASLPTARAGGAVFSVDGKSLFTRSGQGLQRWPLQAEADAATGAVRLGPPEQFLNRPFAGQVDGLRPGADGALALNVYTQGTVLLVDPNRPAEAQLLAGHTKAASAPAVSPDGRWVAVMSQGDLPDKLRVSDTRSGEIVWSYPAQTPGEFSPDSRWLVTGGDACRVWETGTWRREREIASPEGLGTIQHAVFSPDGRVLAIAYAGKVVRLVESETGEELATLPSADAKAVDRVRFSSDGTLLACVSVSLGVQLWDLRRVRAQLADLQLDHEMPALAAGARPASAHAVPISVRVRHDEQPTPLVAPFDAEDAAALQEEWARNLQVPVGITNAADMNLRLIPPGKFLSDQRVPGMFASLPDANLAPFYMGAHEVTVGQFRQFVKETKYRTTGEQNGLGGSDDRKPRRPENIWSHPEYAPTDGHPVTQVTWYDAMAFCDWLSRREGRTYRLPTLQEWNWAAQAGSPHSYYFGDGGDELGDHYWYRGNSGLHSHAVGEKQANPWGLFDLHGNVWELSYIWKRDGKFVDMATAQTGPNQGDTVLMLGGSFWDGVSRRDNIATNTVPNCGYFHFGFRVVLVGNLQAAARKKP